MKNKAKKFIRNPAIPYGVRGGRLPSVLSKEQLLAMLNNCNDSRMAMVIFMGVFQGLRISEMWKLKWQDVDLNTGMIILRDAKNPRRFETGYGKDRYAPISEKFIDVWKKWRIYNPNEEYVVPCRFDHRKRPTLKGLTRLYQDKFVKILKKSGLYAVDYLQEDGKPRHKFHLHTLRHTCGCNMRKMGIPLENIQEFLGHSDVSTTQVYAQITKETLRDIVDKGFEFSLPTSRPLPPVQFAFDKGTLELQKEILDRQIKLKELGMREGEIHVSAIQ